MNKKSINAAVRVFAALVVVSTLAIPVTQAKMRLDAGTTSSAVLSVSDQVAIFWDVLMLRFGIAAPISGRTMTADGVLSNPPGQNDPGTTTTDPGTVSTDGVLSNPPGSADTTTNP